MSAEQIDLSSLRIDASKREKGRPPGSNKKTALWIATIILLAMAAYFLRGALATLFTPAIEVSLTSAVLQSPSQSNAVLNASGYVVAQRKASVASKGTGRLVQLNVEEGDAVKERQILARLEDSDIQAQLLEAKANLMLQEAELYDAETSLKRQRALFDSGLASASERDAAEARHKRVLASIQLAMAQVQAADVALENTLIRAPFDGTVLTKNADVGEIVAPLAASANSRAAVVTIADMASLQVEADVSESRIENIHRDQDCEITLDAYPGTRYSGYVAKIVPTADRAKATVMVKVGFRGYDERVLPEMSAKVLFLKDKQSETDALEPPKLAVQKLAVRQRDGASLVYKVEEQTVVEVPVTTGSDMGSYIEIKNGLNNGDRIIGNLSNEIEDGIKVEVK